tara:strand:- start:1193 stop:2197 length:1005 start_codon:yes stop_codon:yes gene_type:complete
MHKVLFLTEMGFDGKVSRTHDNMRVEFAWMASMRAEHNCLSNYQKISGYDLIIIIWPKGKVYLNSEGIKMKSDKPNLLEKYLGKNVVNVLKQKNKYVAYMQEGPSWFFNDYSVLDQFNYYSEIHSSDIIFCHNEYDKKWYEGLFPNHKVFVLPSLLIEDSINDIKVNSEDKGIIGGNFCRWYGGFQSYLVSQEFGVDMYIPTMHNKRTNEGDVENLNHLPYMNWLEWMKLLSTFKYSIHLMPTIAAGTFSLNSAYFGIPCIGNQNVDTQRLCFPKTSVNVEDIKSARDIACKLKNDSDFYEEVSNESKINYKKHFSEKVFKEKLSEVYKFCNTK